MYPRRFLLVCTLWLAATPVHAQAPVITSAGDPSVRSDTLYQLAVNPRQHPDESAVLLLDDGVVRYEADGTGTKTYRQVAQILTSDAVEQYAEHEFSYAPGHQRLTINWMRVLRLDGSLVSEAPSQVQDADIPASLTNPVYTDAKVRRYSLSGVAPGTIVDWSYTVEETKPFLPGDFFASWSFQTGALTRRSRYLVDLPASVRPHLVQRNVPFHPRETEYRGRRAYLWTAQEIARVTPEEFAADSNSVFMTVQLAGPVEWQTIGSWYAGLSRDRYEIDHGIRVTLRSLLQATKTTDDSLRAVQRWVAQDIRYVSIDLGVGGYQPRMPADVVTTGYGDCKDKTTLFIAALRALGFRAYPVLLNSGGGVDPALPSLTQFNHAIAVIERPQGRVYVDLTADLSPYGELPASDQGRFGLIVYGDGTVEPVTLPESAPRENLSETRIDGTLTPDGFISASYQELGRGTIQYGLRTLFVSQFDANRRNDFARAIATKLFPGATADSLQIFDGRDLTAEARVALQILHGAAARSTADGRTLILSLPFPSMRGMADAATALESRISRRFPIDAAKVIGPVATASQFTLTLPLGWRAQLPRDVSALSKWGVYRASYRQEGQTLLISRTLEGARGIYPPAELSDLAAWLRAVAQDDVSYIVLDSAPGAQATSGTH
jgi:cellulose synthase operon protein C